MSFYSVCIHLNQPVSSHPTKAAFRAAVLAYREPARYLNAVRYTRAQNPIVQRRLLRMVLVIDQCSEIHSPNEAQ